MSCGTSKHDLIYIYLQSLKKKQWGTEKKQKKKWPQTFQI